MYVDITPQRYSIKTLYHIKQSFLKFCIIGPKLASLCSSWRCTRSPFSLWFLSSRINTLKKKQFHLIQELARAPVNSKLEPISVSKNHKWRWTIERSMGSRVWGMYVIRFWFTSCIKIYVLTLIAFLSLPRIDN